jgi:hypothetical protein
MKKGAFRIYRMMPRILRFARINDRLWAMTLSLAPPESPTGEFSEFEFSHDSLFGPSCCTSDSQLTLLFQMHFIITLLECLGPLLKLF